MSTKKISVLGVLLGLIAGALIAIVSGSWMFWLALGVALGLVLGSANRKRDLPSANQLSSNRLSNIRRAENRPDLGHGARI